MESYSDPSQINLSNIIEKIPLRTVKFFQDRVINFHLILLFSKSLVEEYNKEIGLSVEKKNDLILQIIPFVFDYVEKHKRIERKSLKRIQKKMNDREDIIHELEAFSDIGHNPNIISTETWQEKNCCFPCCRF